MFYTIYVFLLSDSPLAPQGYSKLKLIYIYCYSGWGERLVNIFSLYQNIPDVLSFDDHDDDSIGCVHGIRVLSLAWLVLGNSFLYAALSITSAPVTGKSWNLFWI